MGAPPTMSDEGRETPRLTHSPLSMGWTGHHGVVGALGAPSPVPHGEENEAWVRRL